VIEAAVNHPRPVYIRFGKAPIYGVNDGNANFRIGRARVVRDGSDVAFIATGETVIHALLAAGLLAEEGVSCRVVSMHTIKPLDKEAVLEAANQCGAVITVEEHSIYGGLGEACAAVLLQAGFRTHFRIIGIPDEYTITGSQADIFRHYGITMEGLAKVAKILAD
jgi:transketolase